MLQIFGITMGMGLVFMIMVGAISAILSCGLGSYLEDLIDKYYYTDDYLENEAEGFEEF